MAKTMETEQKQINIIGIGTYITGDVNCSGDIRIDGGLTGNLIVKGKVVIGTSGIIKGEISCKNSEVEGKVEGKINVEELLSLKNTSSIIGDIKTQKLAIEPGANFTGGCTMNNAPSTISSTPPKMDEKNRK